MKNHDHKGLRIYKQRDQTQKDTQAHLDQEREVRLLMPPLDKLMDQLLRPSLEREHMIVSVPAHKQLNTEDKTPHN
jgi:hypothetical protein